MTKDNIVLPRTVDGALLLFEKGYRVFPLQANDKTPAFQGWQHWAETATRKKIEEYGTANPMSNWGVYCGPSNLIVIDVDNKHGKNGTQSLRNVISANSPLPLTFSVKTPTGGFHYYYKGSCKSGANVLGDAVDVKSQGGYVVAPGSRIDEKVYEITHDCGSAIPEVPAWLVPLLTPKKAPMVITDDTALPEGGRNEALTRIAGAVRRHGLSHDAILAAIEVENHRICTPPLPDDEVRTIARSVSRYAPEHAKAIQDFGVAPTGAASVRPKRISDYVGDPKRREWLIEGWIPKGEISSLYGSGGVGKSLLSLQLAISAATGQPFVQLPISNKMPTLAIFCEDSDDELHRRVHAIRNAAEFEFLDALKDAPIRLWARVGLINDIAKVSDTGNDVIAGAFRAELEAELQQMNKGPKFVILDTLSDIYLGDENVREKVNKFVKTHLGSLVIKYELTLLVLAHPSRTGTSKGDMLSGSTAWENAVRNRMALLKHKKFPDITVLKRMKSNYAKAGEEIMIQWDKGRFVVSDMASLVESTLSAEQQDMLSAIYRVVPDATGLNDSRIPVNRVAREIGADPELAYLFAGKSTSTIEREIIKMLQYPRVKHKTIYAFKQMNVEGDRTLRWIVVGDIKDATAVVKEVQENGDLVYDLDSETEGEIGENWGEIDENDEFSKLLS